MVFLRKRKVCSISSAANRRASIARGQAGGPDQKSHNVFFVLEVALGRCSTWMRMMLRRTMGGFPP